MVRDGSFGGVVQSLEESWTTVRAGRGSFS